MSEGAKQRLTIVIDVAKTVFHYGFIPTVLYLGKTSRPPLARIEIYFQQIIDDMLY